MDDNNKRLFLAVLISGLIILVWQQLFPYEEAARVSSADQVLSKSTEQVLSKKNFVSDSSKAIVDTNQIVIPEYLVTIKDDIAERTLTNLNGVSYQSYFLNNYFMDAKEGEDPEGVERVSLLDNDAHNNGFTVDLALTNGDTIKLERIPFMLVDSVPVVNVLSETRPELTLNYAATINGVSVTKQLTFFRNRYDYDITYDFTALQSQLSQNGIIYRWKNGTPYTEKNAFEDDNMSLIFLEGKNDFYRFDTGDTDREVFPDSGEVEEFKFFAVRSKYFLTSIFPLSERITSVTTWQKPMTVDDHDERRYFLAFNGNQAKSTFKFYTGPYQRDQLAKYDDEFDFYEMYMNAGPFERTFSFISVPVQWVMLKLFHFIEGMGLPGAFGLTIILFTIVIKILLFPLTKKSYQGMKGMSKLQPEIAKLKEKYGDDMVAMQQQMRMLYEREGINPMSGCLPMLMQMPLLFSLFQIFRSTIELRGESFLWIQNFAAPDAFPIGLDFIGLATINLLPILLAVSQVIMSRQTSQTADPNQKMMVYVLPVVFLFMFYSWNAALNFYYLLFNVITSVQQQFIRAPEKEQAKKEAASPEGYQIRDTSKNLRGGNKKQMYKKK